jgi:hypothetical protein
LVDIVVTDENLHRRSSSIEQLRGRRPGGSGRWRTDEHDSGAADGARRRKQDRLFTFVPADGHHAADWSGWRLRQVAIFWAALPTSCAWFYRYRQTCQRLPVGSASAGVVAQKRPQRHFSGAGSFGDGLEKNLGVLDRAGSAGAIDLPSPRLGWRGAIFYDNRKVFMIDHRQRH